MSKLFFEVLDAKRRSAWHDLFKLPYGGVLGDGTALALQIRHRISYDFDIFYDKPLSAALILRLKKNRPGNPNNSGK